MSLNTPEQPQPPWGWSQGWGSERAAALPCTDIRVNLGDNQPAWGCQSCRPVPTVPEQQQSEPCPWQGRGQAAALIECQGEGSGAAI